MSNPRYRIKHEVRRSHTHRAIQRKLKIMYDLGWFVFSPDHEEIGERICSLDVPFEVYRKYAIKEVCHLQRVKYWRDCVDLRKREPGIY